MSVADLEAATTAGGNLGTLPRRRTSPLVSVIVPCYNYGKYVARAVDSLLDQSLRDIEVIVIDDCSNDDTASILSRYSDNERVRLVRHTFNLGHIKTYNEGLSMARGLYIGLMSADDFAMHSDALERQIAIFESNAGVGLVYTAHTQMASDGSQTHVIPFPHDYVRKGYDEFQFLIWGNYIPASGTLLRRDVQKEIGAYDVRLPHSGDWDMWLRACVRHDVGYISEPMYGYAVHDQNMSHNRIAPEQATKDVVTTIELAFSRLYGKQHAQAKAIRTPALRHGLLQTAWFDVHYGRHRRAWSGLAYAIRLHPAVLMSRECMRLLAELTMSSLLGRGVTATILHGLNGVRIRSRR